MTWLTVTEYLCHKRPRIYSVFSNHNPALSSFVAYHRDCNKSNSTVFICGTGTANSSGTPEIIPGC